MTDVHRDTIMRLGLAWGEGAQNLHNRLARALSCSLIQVDEVWSFVQKKQARVTPEDGPDVGEAYTFTALDASSRFVIGWYVGKRNEESARAFMNDVRARLVVMPAMTSDGFAPYVSAIGSAFGPGIDYAMTVKNYGSKRRRDDDHRYEPSRDPFITKKAIFGAPNLEAASTAYIERQNGTMRHHVGRMRRLCQAFSKRLPSHRAAVALGYVHYNFCHVVKTLRVTPAMQLGLADGVWSLAELDAALMTSGPCEAPARQPLAPRVPETTARELPNGRGFLRVVKGGKDKPSEAPAPATTQPGWVASPVMTPAAAEPLFNENGQGNLFAWNPPSSTRPPAQLLLFPREDED
ncbi:transposase [Polyangium sp. 15x6]|uniref:transposase n=1 Tax=Polyangium sp. 15x6 TaxID=3042687 RepID=UPI00249A34DE|nr:transposase [Polyangium sp. 15x6]MDI3291020.1 transposase [Polyangium sp. 15x6]